ncbi:MAG: [FeFe] hydrogenase H-cluster radical SAM maturase HydG [Phycisphaerae bacterium]
MSRTMSRTACDFINDPLLNQLIQTTTDAVRVREIIAKSMEKQPLELAETAALIAASDPALVEEIFEAARELKRRVYGNRIVLFAPLYIGNECVNDCTYCGFRRSNKEAVRRTLSVEDIRAQVEALEDKGHKRLILVFGEHPRYNPQAIADTVTQVYSIKKGKGEIRRVNINAAPMDHAGYKLVHDAGIGTYQIFQETYHKPTYAQVHPPGTLKGDYLWRLDGLSRAFEAGCDDVGIGALFGLYDWRFELLGLVSHARFLMQHYRVGPHTISFPRMRPASGMSSSLPWAVSDYDFMRIIAILRLSVPYTGMILTARETAEVRRAALGFGVSQIDAGSRIELGGYTEAGDAQQQCIEKEQFQLGDVRSLDEVVRELAQNGYIPSFCTACYRLGRTGEEFMEYAIPGFIEKLCTPNALSTAVEYATDYATPETAAAIRKLEESTLANIPESSRKTEIVRRLGVIRTTEQRDLYF